MLIQFTAMGHGQGSQGHPRSTPTPRSPSRLHKPAVALIGDAKPVLRRLLDVLPAHNSRRAPRARAEMQERQAKLAQAPREARRRSSAILDAIRAELPEDGIFVDEVTQMGFAARLALPVYKPRTFLSPGYQDNLGWGFATALGAQDARPRRAGAVDHRRRRLHVHRERNGDRGAPPHPADRRSCSTTAPSAMCAASRRSSSATALIASDLANPDFVKFAESFGAAAERAREPAELRAALRRGFARRDGPTLIEVPVGPMPSPGSSSSCRRCAVHMSGGIGALASPFQLRYVSPAWSRSPRRRNWPTPANGWRSTPSSPSTPSSCAKPPITRSSASRSWREPTKPW